MRLLVVEDEIHLQTIIKKRLIKEHYSVDVYKRQVLFHILPPLAL